MTDARTDRLRVLIVDDEPLARMRLRSLLADTAQPPVEVVGDAASAADALHALARIAVDVVLLDIKMPGPDGLELGEKLRTHPAQPAVIFVTAHAEHALAAFEIAAVDYLTKPVRRTRLQEALMRAAQRRPQLAAAVAAVPAAAAAEAPVLVVSDRGRVLRLPVADVMYLRADQKYVTLRTRNHAYVLDDTLADLEQRLGAHVVRVHRKVLVAKAAVRRLEKHAASADNSIEDASDGGEAWAVQVDPTGEWLPVSRRQLSAVREALAAEGL